MNLDLLKRIGFEPKEYEVAILFGFDIQIGPLANLVPSEQSSVFGILVAPTHRELGVLYRYTEQQMGTAYLPQAALVTTREGKSRPALCYLAASTKSEPPSGEYLDLIIGPARTYGFLDWYLKRLESFRH